MKRIFSLSVLVVFVLVFVVGCGDKTTSLQGKVVDGKGQPLAKVKVVAKMLEPIKGFEQSETITGSDGVFTFNKLCPTSEYQLNFYSDLWKKEEKMKADTGPEKKNKILSDPFMIRVMESKGGFALDTKTDLMWATEDNGSDINWSDAKKYCESYKGGGYTNWRMPTQDELAGYYESASKLSTLTACCSWASETRGSEAAYFSFHAGKGGWFLQSDVTERRAFPVRSIK